MKTYYIVFDFAGMGLLLPDSIPTKHDKKEKDKTVQLGLVGSVHQEFAKVANNFKAINWETYWDLFLLKFVMEISFQCFYASFGLVLAAQFSMTQKQIGYMLAMHAFLFVVFNPLYATAKIKLYSSDKSGIARIRHAFLLLAVTFIGFIFAPNWLIYCFFIVPLSAVRVLADTTFTEILVLRTGETDKGTVMGTFESLISLSAFTTPLILGLATDIWGYYAPSVIALIPSSISIYIVNKMHTTPEKYTQ